MANLEVIPFEEAFTELNYSKGSTRKDTFDFGNVEKEMSYYPMLKFYWDESDAFVAFWSSNRMDRLRVQSFKQSPS